jgi:gamma-glutamyltranspeptidase/glutathione hydrolase
LNASGKSPAAWSPERFKGLSKMPTTGWDAVTVPGAVSAWVELSSRFGKLPFELLFVPALEYASDGFLVSPLTAAAWSRSTRLADQPGFAEGFMPVPAAGSLFRTPAHARTLTEVSKTKGESFYKGALAEAIIRCSNENGGCMTLDDLASHEPLWVDLLEVNALDAAFYEIPPNGQGIAALIALGILERLNMKTLEPDGADSIHLQIEAMRVGFAEAFRHVSDPATAQLNPTQLLSNEYLDRRASQIDPTKAGQPAPTMPTSRDTVYLTAADQNGMMVSFIQSNYMGFGSGVVVPGTGIAMQNRGAGFTLEPGHPNQVRGGKRPFHTIIPAFAMRDGKPLMSFGVMGGHMQPQGHVQMALRVALWGQNPQSASDAPRWQVNESGDVLLEQGLASAVADDLRARGHTVQDNMVPGHFGGAQLIVRLKDGYVAGSDHRKDGQAVGF